MEIEENIASDNNTEANADCNQSVENAEESLNEENASEGLESVTAASSAKITSEKQNLQPEKKKIVKLPLSRIKYIMKMDPDVKLVSQDVVFLVTKATEFFLEYLGKEAATQARTIKRKTILKRDVEAVIKSVPNLCFLDGAMD